MNNKAIYKTKFKVNLFDVTTNKKITIPALFKYLYEAGSEHHLFVADNLLDRYINGSGWLLVHLALQVNDYPKYPSHFYVETYLTEIQNIKAIRVYKFLDINNNLLGVAQALWAYFDINKRRLKPIEPDYKQLWQTYPHPILQFQNNITPNPEGTLIDTISVRKSDLDLNQHLTNIQILQWILDTYDIDFRPKSMQIKFFSEALLNHQIQIFKLSTTSHDIITLYNSTTNKTTAKAIVK